MSAQEWLIYLTLAFGLGVLGQIFRVGVGIKKMFDKNPGGAIKEDFNANKLLISLALGAAAAVITAAIRWEPSTQTLDKEFMFTLMAAGYAGSDIIEGLIERSLGTVKEFG